MSGFWTVLGLEPTEDISAIKRACAEKAKACHPEEDPEGFLKLRNAYRAALDYAGGGEEASPEAPPAGAEELEDEGWSLSGRPEIMDEGPNPFADHPAAKAFLVLYTGKQRKNPQAWMDYFTSGEFLDVAWERRFAALLLEQATRLEAEYRVNREFLTWLCVAYQFRVLRAEFRNPDGSPRVECQFQINREAQFSGQEFIFEIAAKGPAPKYPRGNELAMLHSFQEYRRMVRIAGDGVWSEQEIGQYSEIIGCYAAGYITDKCQQRGDMDHERHPAGLRLLTHFFRRAGLPEELYRIAWEKLDLKTALMGRAKILYGALRELVLERLPELAEQKKTSFAKLRTDFHDYAAGTYKRGGEHAQATGEDIRRTDAFFFLLPLTMAVYSQYEAVKGEILRRLPDTAAPEEGRELIASCLADGVCGLPEPDAVGLGTAFERDGEDEEDGEPPEAFEPLPPESVLPFEVFAENTEFLYVCTWFQRDRILALFQQTPVGKQLVEGGQFSDIGDAQTAVALAKRLLDDQLHPKGFPMEALKVLPEAVYAQWDYAVPARTRTFRPSGARR